MRIISALLLVLLPFSILAGGNSWDVELLSLKKTGVETYILEYKNLDRGETTTVYLEYNPIQYLNLSILNKEKFDQSISLLRKQLESKKPTRFGWFGGGPCIVNKHKGIYRSDALDIYDEDFSTHEKLVVYAFCEYK